MKFMKIALSVVAIAAIATIYSTGAFVSQTHGMDNTVAGFLVISNAEMAQQVGGDHPGYSKGIPLYYRETPEVPGNYCAGIRECYEQDRKMEVRGAYAICAPCMPPLNIFNRWQWNWPEYTRLEADGSRIKVPKFYIVTCVFENQIENLNCKVNKQHNTLNGWQDDCSRYLGDCN